MRYVYTSATDNETVGLTLEGMSHVMVLVVVPTALSSKYVVNEKTTETEVPVVF